MIDHLTFDSSRMDDVLYMMADLYESSHEPFKDDYEKTYKRLHTAMSEAPRLYNTGYRTFGPGAYLTNIQESSQRQCLRKQVYNRKKEGPEILDVSFLIETGQWTTLWIIYNMRQTVNGILRNIWGPDLEEVWNSCQFKQIAGLLEETGLLTALKLLKEKSCLLGLHKDILRYVRVRLLISSYVFVYPHLQLSQNPRSQDGRKGILIEKKSFQRSQRVVAGRKFLSVCSGPTILCYGGGWTGWGQCVYYIKRWLHVYPVCKSFLLPKRQFGHSVCRGLRAMDVIR